MTKEPNHRNASRPGKKNLITDVEGILVGSAESEAAATGVTVIRCQDTYVCACDSRGGAPATRETDVLRTENLVGAVDAIVLSGGSVFGLAAADGVASYLSNQDIGLRLSEKSPAIPIVSAAALHDLGNEGDKDWGENPPYHALGVEAVKQAGADITLGAAGAGRGAKAGSLPGGLGSASIVLENGIIVGALAAVNSVGSAYHSDGRTFLAWSLEIGDEFGARAAPTSRDGADPFPPHSRLDRQQRPRENTTLAVVAASFDLTHAEAKRVAIMAQNGIARAIRPAHTIFDGDIVFAIGAGKRPDDGLDPPARAMIVAEIGAAAADCLARAIARGVFAAEPQGD